jgi:MarR family transcriptional regulator, 2-MHQ and catechol-resistance regulon repressor
LEVFATMTQYATPREKTQRAFRAYTDLLDTAEWMRAEMHGPLELFDLTMSEFRLLELLYREGALPVADAGRRRRMKRQNTDELIARLRKRGFVRRVIVRLPPVEFAQAHLANSKEGEPREGRRISVVGLTKPGKKLMGDVLPRHSKVVKAFMRALTSREQDSLSRICRKLREGDIMKFVSEITHEDVED